MNASSEKPFDDFGYLELLLLYYDISKTIVFWTNVFLISSTLINGSFGQLCWAASQNAETAVRKIYYMFRMKPLDFQEDTMLMRQQRHLEKNHIEKSAWLKRKMVEQEIQNERDEYLDSESLYHRFSDIIDRLVEALDSVLGTKCRKMSENCQQYCCKRADSMPFDKPTTKDRRSFRNLNTSTVG
ncbi:unnamed protein product [Macrosiphum euphorbiae]|uniref:Uncharacterized protein n=1 Tax=Macrosiphum euphorbiae TaxID=13131 RepID=A0AAV0XT67_9HEMI|nr:unnamed protein product [Macrosiphum euphorbiae]